MRLLDAKSLAPVTWLYLRMALTGACDASVKYVMIDEVQDYSAAQIAVLGRYYKRAHFMLLGDKNQAVEPGGATFGDIDEVMGRLHGRVDRCHLMTSYRSSPEITELFASLLPASERMRISSVQREQVPARVRATMTTRNTRAICVRRSRTLARRRPGEAAPAPSSSRGKARRSASRRCSATMPPRWSTTRRPFPRAAW